MNKRLDVTEAKLTALVAEGLTIRQIGARLGCSFTNVRYWMKKHGVSPNRGPRNKKALPSKRKCHVCGETDPSRFYGSHARTCSGCHNASTIMKGRRNREILLSVLGGTCCVCGYNKYKCALDAHHVDPKTKDPGASSMRSWSESRLREELKKCVLLCKNCHAALHAGEYILTLSECGEVVSRSVRDGETAGSSPAIPSVHGV